MLVIWTIGTKHVTWYAENQWCRWHIPAHLLKKSYHTQHSRIDPDHFGITPKIFSCMDSFISVGLITIEVISDIRMFFFFRKSNFAQKLHSVFSCWILSSTLSHNHHRLSKIYCLSFCQSLCYFQPRPKMHIIHILTIHRQGVPNLTITMINCTQYFYY